MNKTNDLIDLSPGQFIDFLKKENITRCYFIYDAKNEIVRTSHKQLLPIAEFIQNDKRDFMMHEGIFLQVSRKYDTLQGAFIHRTNRGQAAGGVRYWSYKTMEEYLRDGLRLAVGMTMKNALSGIWWGGGKGVMAQNPAVDKNNPMIRLLLYQEFGELMSSLRGCYVTAEDVGTDVTDMANVFMKTRFTTCIPPRLGGSGNPSVPTARGVISGMEAALEFLGTGTLSGKTVAVQGMGHVATPLIGYLFEKDVSRVVACDINPHIVKEVVEQYSGYDLNAKVVSLDDTSIFQTECDIFSPCATGAILNPKTIPTIKAKIVCGAANNQLEDSERDGQALFNKGVVYVPDFLTNRMGIVNCANEQYGYVNNDPFIEQHLQKDWEFSIYRVGLKVLQESRATKTPPAEVALRIANELSMQNHPIFGPRSQQIINSLVDDKWHETSFSDKKQII
ncbi:MAG: Glu/Leu/Phe/Val dehydrogenase [Ignavibacteriales bacterium]|nr:Glu/Leu/Phe/Val dehydrogenase [Ignavibacteriales bacterium]